MNPPCPSEIWPVSPVRMTRPSSAIAEDADIRELRRRGSRRERAAARRSPPRGARSRRGGQPEQHQTRLTTTRPSRPAGRKSRTRMSTVNAIGSSRSPLTNVDVGAEQRREDAEQRGRRRPRRRGSRCRPARPPRTRRSASPASSSGSGRGSARPSSRRPRRGWPRSPSPSRTSSRRARPCRRLGSGAIAAARIARPSFVKRKNAQSSSTVPSVTTIMPTSWRTMRDAGDRERLGAERAEERLWSPATRSTGRAR